jgi:DNA-binding response OmpR family regulator
MKILVIDDDPDTIGLLRVILEPAFHEVITATSGPEGIYIARQQSPDLIILDMILPEMNGPEICRTLRKFNKAPILILSALDSPSMVIASLEAGADDYLIKPITNGMLVAHINKFLRRAVKPREARITV